MVPLIWGKYIYDMVINKQLEDELEQLQSQPEMVYSPIHFNKDTFELELPDRDPFMNGRFKPDRRKNPKTEQGNKPPKQKEIKKVDEVKAPPKWPAIQYFGFVKNWDREQEKPLCMLKVDGRMVKLGVGEEYKEVVIEAAYRDSVMVRHQGNIKSVSKG